MFSKFFGSLVLSIVFVLGFCASAQATPQPQCGVWTERCPGVDFQTDQAEATPTFYKGKVFFGGDSLGLLWEHDLDTNTCEIAGGDGRNGSWTLGGVDDLLVSGGLLWIAVEGFGVYYYDGTTFTYDAGDGRNGSWVIEPNQFPWPEHHGLVEHGGNIWITYDNLEEWVRDGATGLWSIDTPWSRGESPGTLSWAGNLYLLGYNPLLSTQELWQRDASGWTVSRSWPANGCIFNEAHGGLTQCAGNMVTAIEANDPSVWWGPDAASLVQIGGNGINCSWTDAEGYCNIQIANFGGRIIATLGGNLSGPYPYRSYPWEFNPLVQQWVQLQDAANIWGDGSAGYGGRIGTTLACGEAAGSAYFIADRYAVTGIPHLGLWQFSYGTWTPPELTGVRVTKVDPLNHTSSNVHIVWDPSPVAGSCGTYNVTGGLISDLWADRGFNHSICVAQDLSPTLFDDPSTGSWWFLINVATLCGRGTHGSSFYPEVPPAGPNYRQFLDDPLTDPCP